MSWIQKLYETYNNCLSMVGRETGDYQVPLLPICHTTQMAQIEITIDGNGYFSRARVIPKNEARTIIPCTEASGGRTSGPAAHPLCDKLQYVAVDYSRYAEAKKAHSALYIAELEKWCASEYSHSKVVAVLKYIQQGTLIRDLIDQQVLVAGEDGKLLPKWDKDQKGDTPEIFKIFPSQSDAFVRWIVEIPGEPEGKVWRDSTLWDSWIRCYSTTKKQRSLCYVTGEPDLSADMHPAKLRNDGDKAKLISSNDMDGYTFRGRFITADQAASVGFETTQKAHFALRWLISRQGYRKGDLAVVAWATSGAPVPQPTDDTFSMLGYDDLSAEDNSVVSTAQEVAILLKQKMAGYAGALGDTVDIVVMAVNSATPGRLSITYYRDLKGSDFLQRIDTWHESCSWIHRYRKVWATEGGKPKSRLMAFIGAPAPADIAEAAYGPRVDDRLKQATVTRLLPCIIDGQQVPRDLVESTVRRACNRASMEYLEWHKTLTIACALYQKI